MEEIKLPAKGETAVGNMPALHVINHQMEQAEGLKAEAHWVGVVGVCHGANEQDKKQVALCGVFGKAIHNGTGVLGESDEWVGVHGISQKKAGVRGECNGPGAGVEAENKAGGFGLFAEGSPAGFFRGDIQLTGDIKLLNPMNADCAEDFDILEENVEPGTVMVLTDTGSLQSSHQAYDNKVVGIISGAGGYKPAFILNRFNESEIETLKDDKKKNKRRLPIALMGKVFCKVDARQSPIEVGDLLTTSSTRGFAMKAEDPMKAFGAVIGKALGSVKNGLGMIPVLVNLQ